MTRYQVQFIVPMNNTNQHKAKKDQEYLEQCFKEIIGTFTSYTDELYRIYSLICTEEQSGLLSTQTRGRCALLEFAPLV